MPTRVRVVVSLSVDDCCPLRVGRAGRRTEGRGVGLRARSSPSDAACLDALGLRLDIDVRASGEDTPTDVSVDLDALLDEYRER
jgi:hypothetical protein